jgi:hypothetical protein
MYRPSNEFRLAQQAMSRWGMRPMREAGSRGVAQTVDPERSLGDHQLLRTRPGTARLRESAGRSPVGTSWAACHRELAACTERTLRLRSVQSPQMKRRCPEKCR